MSWVVVPEIVGRIRSAAETERHRQERVAGKPGTMVAAYAAIPMFVTFTSGEMIELDDYLRSLASAVAPDISGSKS